MNFSAEQLAAALAGVTYPARMWQITAWAEHNGAAQVVRDALLNIPAATYAGPGDIVDALRMSYPGRIAPIRPCRHRRHPRNCRGHGWQVAADHLAS